MYGVMISNCPNVACNSFLFKKDGSYFRKNDSRQVQRYCCKSCGKKFSKSTFELEYGHKKRRINPIVFKLLASGNSQRRIAIILGVNKNTIERKFLYCAQKAKLMHESFLQNCKQSPIEHIQIDDQITSEHTKLKPLTISVAVDSNTRKILGAVVSQIPAFGHLAHISRKKYGKRANHHKKGLEELFKTLQPIVTANGIISSDEHNLYPSFIHTYLPGAIHQTHKSVRACVSGQGELKKTNFDPLFCINHTLAMFRDNIKRLARKTWCNTKKAQMLQKHLYIYMAFHNSVLIK